MGRRLECTDDPRTTAVDRRSTPSARADRQDLLPMFRCPDPGVFADLIMILGPVRDFPPGVETLWQRASHGRQQRSHESAAGPEAAVDDGAALRGVAGG